MSTSACLLTSPDFQRQTIKAPHCCCARANKGITEALAQSSDRDLNGWRYGDLPLLVPITPGWETASERKMLRIGCLRVLTFLKKMPSRPFPGYWLASARTW